MWSSHNHNIHSSHKAQSQTLGVYICDCGQTLKSSSSADTKRHHQSKSHVDRMKLKQKKISRHRQLTQYSKRYRNARSPEQIEESKRKARERSRTKRSHLTPDAKSLINRSKVTRISALKTKRRKLKEEEDEARYQQKMQELDHELTKKKANNTTISWQVLRICYDMDIVLRVYCTSKCLSLGSVPFDFPEGTDIRLRRLDVHS